MKTIKICDKECNIDCNAYTFLQFKQVFGHGIFKDIQVLKDFFTKQAETIIKNENKENDSILTYVDDFVEAITRIAYIFIYTVDTSFENYEDFMKDIPRLSIDDDWILEVTELAVEKFC